MTKPSQIWFTLTICALLIVGAMAWLTKHVLDLESERALAVEKAELDNRVRLALVSMDSAASGLLVIENQRPPSHFRAFYNPGDVVDEHYNYYAQSEVLKPSPLANELPEFVKLHFEILPNGGVRSPQVPSVDDGVWENILSPSKKVLSSANANLEELRNILKAPASPGQQAGFSNADALCAAAHNPTPEAAPPLLEDRKSKGWVAQQVLESTAQERIQSDSYRREFSKTERGNRRRVYEETLKMAANESNIVENTGKLGQRSGLAQKEGGSRVPAASAPARRTPELEDAAGQPSGVTAPEIQAESQMPVADRDAVALDGPEETGSVSPFRVLWLSGELFAVRIVEVDGVEGFQGVWFQAEALEEYLLETVESLLPSASLEAL